MRRDDYQEMIKRQQVDHCYRQRMMQQLDAVKLAHELYEQRRRNDEEGRRIARANRVALGEE